MMPAPIITSAAIPPALALFLAVTMLLPARRLRLALRCFARGRSRIGLAVPLMGTPSSLPRFALIRIPIAAPVTALLSLAVVTPPWPPDLLELHLVGLGRCSRRLFGHSDGSRLAISSGVGRSGLGRCSGDFFRQSFGRGFDSWRRYLRQRTRHLSVCRSLGARLLGCGSSRGCPHLISLLLG